MTAPAAREVRRPRVTFAERVEQGLAELSRSETGAALVAEARKNGVRYKNADGGMWFTDGDNTVGIDDEYLAYPDWQLAVLLGHELEHARQRALQITGEANRAYRELGAFFVQCRVWVELGAPWRAADLPMNARNSQDMWAWVEHPLAIAAALEQRAGLKLTGAPAGSAYWREVLAAEDAWRLGRPMPQGRDSASAARFVLNQALGFRSGTKCP